MLSIAVTSLIIEVHNQLSEGEFDAVILAVAHDEFKELDVNKSTIGRVV